MSARKEEKKAGGRPESLGLSGSRVSLGYTDSTGEAQSVAGNHLWCRTIVDDRARRRGIRRPTSDHSWIRDECLHPRQRETLFPCRLVVSTQVIGVRREGERGVGHWLSGDVGERGGWQAWNSGAKEKEEREGRRKHGGGKQLREGEERTALYDNAL